MVTCAGTLAMVQHPGGVKARMGDILNNIVVFQGSPLSRTLVLISKFIIALLYAMSTCFSLLYRLS